MNQEELLKLIDKAAKDGRTSLDLCFKDLTALPAEIGELKKLTTLYLHGNKLTSVPAEIGQLNKLTVLSLHENDLASLSAEIGQLKNLTELHLSNNKLRSLPAEIGQLKMLTRLSMHHNELTALPADIFELKSLRILDVSSNELTVLPVEIGQLVNLAMLDLGGNHLTSLPAEIGQLKGLTGLSLGSNKLTSLPAEIGQLNNVIKLVLGGNQLTVLPAEIGEVKNVTELYLDNNNLTVLPGEVFELSNLTTLHLHANNLTALPGGIDQLKNLTALTLSGNPLASLPAELWELKVLKELHLARNSLTSLPPEIGRLNDLKTLNLVGNDMTSLPSEISQLKNLTELKLDGNPLKEPPREIVAQGTKAVLAYLRELEQQQSNVEVARLYEAKLFVAGAAAVGKTALTNRLINGKPLDIQRTEGIDIHPWMVETEGIKELRIDVHNFGEQEVYYRTHRFFLTKRAVYLLVWEARSDDDVTVFDYWLNVITLLSDGAPIIVVMNKCDERTKTIDEAAIQKAFGNVVSFHKVSAKENIGIDGLRDRIIEEVANLDHIGISLPKQWVDIRVQLDGMREQNYISYQEYRGICEDWGLDEKQAGFLAGYYHELGVMLHFDDNPILKDIVFLNPEWATGAVYRVVDCPAIQDSSGRFHLDMLKEVWKDYPEDQYAALLELMIKFELCFRLGVTHTYIVSELLPFERPVFKLGEGEDLRVVYNYAFMPAGIITRFIVREFEIIKGETYWKNGVLLEWEGTRAVVECEPFARRIGVRIQGEDIMGLLAIIRHDIASIHETLGKLNVEEQIACICTECKGSDAPFYHAFMTLKKLMENRRRTVQCGKSLIDVDIIRLLGKYGYDIETEERALEWVKARDAGLEKLTEEKKAREKERKQEILDGHLSAMIDVAGGVDRLGRDRLVGALAQVFKKSKGVEGFTVALMGDWGAGKTTVATLLQQKLKEEYPDEFLVATFRAWEYEHADNIAAGMTQEVVKGLMEGVGRCERFRIWRKFVWEVYRADFTRLWWFCVIPVLASVLIYVPLRLVGVGNETKILGVKVVGGGIIGVVVIVCGYVLKNMKKIVDHPLTARLDIYLELPRYGKYLGLIPVLKTHIKTLCKLRLPARLKSPWFFGNRLYHWKKDQRLLVVVDDLDRCRSECIASVLDAVRLVMEINNVIVLICIDHRIAFRAIEERYRGLAEKTNGDTMGDRSASDIARDYLGKIIHLPVRLPKVGKADLNAYIHDKLFAEVVEVQEEPESEPGDGQEETVPKVDGDEKTIKHERSAKKDDKGEDKLVGDGEPKTETHVNDEKKVGPPDDKNKPKDKRPIEDEPTEDVGEMRETSKERDYFKELAGLFDLRNPRQLLRLRNSYRLLKKLDIERAKKWEQIMVPLFWLEFLNSQHGDVRGKCKRSIKSDAKVEEKGERVKRAIEIVERVKSHDDVKTIILRVEAEKELMDFVEIAVLPHDDGAEDQASGDDGCDGGLDGFVENGGR